MKLLIVPIFYYKSSSFTEFKLLLRLSPPRCLEAGELFTSSLLETLEKETCHGCDQGALGVGARLPDDHFQHSFYISLDCPRGLCSNTPEFLGESTVRPLL